MFVTPYHYIGAALALMTALGIALRWHHRREATTAQVKSVSEELRNLKSSFIAMQKHSHAFELKVAEQYVHRDDYVVSVTRLDHKLDRILQHMAGVNA